MIFRFQIHLTKRAVVVERDTPLLSKFIPVSILFNNARQMKQLTRGGSQLFQKHLFMGEGQDNPSMICRSEWTEKHH